MISLLAALLLQAGATGDAPKGPATAAAMTDDVLTDPRWVRVPSARDFANNYPAAASRNGIQGRVVLLCKVSEKGDFETCRVDTEEPAGQHFGDASLRIATQFRMQAQAADGRPVAGRTIRIPMAWRLVRATAAAKPTMEAWPAALPACAKPGEPTRFYPEPGVRAVKDAEVVLQCRTGQDRRYTGCEVVKESPGGLNFGTAALAMARCDAPFAGAPGEVIKVPVHFRIPGRGRPAPSGGITVTAQGYWTR